MAVTGANAGLKREWGNGFSGWDPDMDRNLMVLDSLAQLKVKSVGANTPPGSPSSGDTHIVGASPTGAWSAQAAAIAIYNGTAAAWAFVVPHVGWEAYCETDSKSWRYTNAGWTHFMTTSDPGVITLPQGLNLGDTTLTVYKEGTWTPTVTGATIGGTGSPTYSGTYTKIGRLVHWTARVIPGFSTFASTLFTTTITNLPFTALSGSWPFTGATFGGDAYPQPANALGVVIGTVAYLPTSAAYGNDIFYSGVYQV